VTTFASIRNTATGAHKLPEVHNFGAKPGVKSQQRRADSPHNSWSLRSQENYILWIEVIVFVNNSTMGKRSCTSNPAVIELEGDALRSSKRRVLKAASSTAAMSLLAMRTKLPTAFSEEAFPLNEPSILLHPQRQVEATKYYPSSITDDEGGNEKSKVVASKKRRDVFHDGLKILTQPILTQPVARNPISSIMDTRRREAPNHPRMIPLGRPLPPAPLLPFLLLSRGVIPSTHKS
jgi:hypothetical protein